MNSKLTFLDAPVLCIQLDQQNLVEQHAHTNVLSSSLNQYWGEALPYGNFIVQAISFNFNKLESLKEFIMADLLVNKGGEGYEGLLVKQNQMWQAAESTLEKHLLMTMRFQYLHLIQGNLSLENRIKSFKLSYELLTKPNGDDILDIFSYLDLAPFRELSESRKNEISDLNILNAGFTPPVVNLLSSKIVITFSEFIDNVIKTYIWHMKQNNIFLHQCSICQKWFMRYEKRKSSFCGGSTCLSKPKETPKARYLEKLSQFNYRKKYDKEYNYWYQRRRRGTITDQQFKDWFSKAKAMLEKVEAGKLAEDEFTDWLANYHKVIDRDKKM